jgi:hypothetical protein
VPTLRNRVVIFNLEVKKLIGRHFRSCYGNF